MHSAWWFFSYNCCQVLTVGAYKYTSISPTTATAASTSVATHPLKSDLPACIMFLLQHMGVREAVQLVARAQEHQDIGDKVSHELARLIEHPCVWNQICNKPDNGASVLIPFISIMAKASTKGHEKLIRQCAEVSRTGGS